MLRFTVLHELHLDGEQYDAGEHEIARPTKVQLRLLAHAAHAGAVRIDDGDVDDAHIQSQEDGEAALKAAQGEANPVTGEWDGPWSEANRELHALLEQQKREAEEAEE